MPFKLFIVTVPAKVAKVGNPGDSSTVITPVAAKVREYVASRPEVEWISEEPFQNGKAWWTSFMFTVVDSTAEKHVDALTRLGVGQSVAAAAGREPSGKGMILVLGVDIQRIGSRPKVCGHPASVPYGTNASPPGSTDVTPTPTILKKPNISFDTSDTQDVVVEDKSAAMTVVDDAEIEDDDEVVTGQVSGKVKKGEHDIEEFTASFVATIQSRVSVDSVIQYCHSASEFSFDYVMLIFNASVIACVGLVTNNTVVIVASMLVSPLMGPILAVTFGAVVESGMLLKRGFFSETVGLLMCILFGFVGGLCAAPACGSSWPTTEMASRGIPSALWTGVAIAIPSGFGAALSVLGNNTSSLVGVAISASLLPPAVNCGVLLAALALQNTRYIDESNTTEVNGEPYTFSELNAGISFAVTLINIVLIYVCAYLMFLLKGLGAGSNAFWNKHVKNVRNYNRALRDPEKRHEYEKAFIHAQAHRAPSFKADAMEMTKASWKWDPFKTSFVDSIKVTHTASETASEGEP